MQLNTERNMYCPQTTAATSSATYMEPVIERSSILFMLLEEYQCFFRTRRKIEFYAKVRFFEG